MIFKYGSFSHPQDSVGIRSINRRHQFSPRGERAMSTFTFEIAGTIREDSISALTTSIDELVDAYSSDDQDFGLLENDGTTQTAHFVSTASTFGGTRVIAGPNFTQDQGGAEYATVRSFTVTLEYDVENSSLILLSFNETVTIIGTGGPRKVIQEPLIGPPVEQLVQQRTAYRAVQAGDALSHRSWFAAPPPIWPSAEIESERRLGAVAPRRKGGAKTEYRRNWQYNFQSPTPLVGFPTTI